MNVTLLTEKDLRRCIQLDMDVIQAIDEGFTLLSQGDVTMPPIMRIDFPENNGEVDVKSAYVRGIESFAIKVSSGFFDNYRLGLPSLSGMMVLLSAKTGLPEAVLLDNGYLTDIRTGAAGAVAARHLARSKIQTVGVIGAGSQARYQLIGLSKVRSFEKVLVYSLAGTDEYVAEMPDVLGVKVIPAASAGEVVRSSDVVVTTTPSKQAYLEAGWLHPGLHITAMGSDAEDKRELCPEVFGAADVLVCDSRKQSFRLGEYHHGREAGVIASDDEVHELGEITSHKKPGRRSESEITLCDLTGTGMQDTIIATLAYQRAKGMGLGQQISSGSK
jgi:ectoine utilization protein EutC